MVSIACSDRSTRAAKMTVTFSPKFFTSQICDIWLQEIYVLCLTGLKLVSIPTVVAWVSREPLGSLIFFFTSLLFSLRTINRESLSKIQHFELIAMFKVKACLSLLKFLGTNSVYK